MRNRCQRVACVLAVAGLGLTPLPAAIGEEPFFKNLGAMESIADMSADGSTLITTKGSYWTEATGLVSLGSPPGWSGSVRTNGISADGSVIVGSLRNEAGKTEAFRWENGMFEPLGSLGDGGGSSEAFGVSADGTTIAGKARWPDGVAQAFRWTAEEGMVGLGDVPSGSGRSVAFGISDDGSTVVGVQYPEGARSEAFRWSAEEGMVGLGGLASDQVSSSAFDVSRDGSVVVGVSRSDRGSEAFRWTLEDGMVGLGGLAVLPNGWFISTAEAVSGDGRIVVGNSVIGTIPGGRPPGNIDRPFYWEAEHGMRFLQDVLQDDYGLDLMGWELWYVTDISADGRTIVGDAIPPDGGRVKWMARVPEPGTGILWLVACLWVGRRRRGRGSAGRHRRRQRPRVRGVDAGAVGGV